MEIKEITHFYENETKKTRLTICENGKDTEIIFEGDGKIKASVEV